MTYLYDSTIHLICPFADKKKARQLLADIDKKHGGNKPPEDFLSVRLRPIDGFEITHVYEKRAENKEALRQLLQDFGEANQPWVSANHYEPNANPDIVRQTLSVVTGMGIVVLGCLNLVEVYE